MRRGPRLPRPRPPCISRAPIHPGQRSLLPTALPKAISSLLSADHLVGNVQRGQAGREATIGDEMNDGLNDLLWRNALCQRAADMAPQLPFLAHRHKCGNRQQAARLQVDVRALAAPGVAEAELDQLPLDV